MTKVDLITGFLGAGKTTYISYYTKWLKKNNISFIVIENEYGMSGVDSALFEADGIETKELAGGCICCTLKVNFHDQLLRASEKGIDRIIVEPSGIYDLSQFFTVMNSDMLKGKVEIGSVITVVDVNQLEFLQKENYTFFNQQLKATGGVLLSKTHLLKKKVIEDLGDVPILFADDFDNMCDDDFKVFSNAMPRNTQNLISDTSHVNVFQSATLFPEGVYTKEQGENILHNLISGNCGNVLRAKGYLNSHSGSLILNSVGNTFDVNHTAKTFTPMINVIGTNLNRKNIKNLF